MILRSPDEARILHLLYFAYGHPYTTTEIAQRLSLGYYTTHYRLEVLVKYGFVKRVKNRKQVFYYPYPEMKGTAEILIKQWRDI
jgi:DNA-binding MarR family transcriptional regulator